MKRNKIKKIVALVAILITITVMITFYSLSDDTEVNPKSATLVQIMPEGRYIDE